MVNQWRRSADAWSEYRDESFVLQFLSPRLIREMRLVCGLRSFRISVSVGGSDS